MRNLSGYRHSMIDDSEYDYYDSYDDRQDWYDTPSEIPGVSLNGGKLLNDYHPNWDASNDEDGWCDAAWFEWIADNSFVSQGSHERLCRTPSKQKRFCQWGNRESKMTVDSCGMRHVPATGWKRETRRSKQWQKCQYASVTPQSLKHLPLAVRE